MFCLKNLVVHKKYLKNIKKLPYKKLFLILKPGDCIIHHCEVIHGSKDNRSNLDRVGLVISYKAKGKSAKVDTKKKKMEISEKLVKKNLKKKSEKNIEYYICNTC